MSLKDQLTSDLRAALKSGDETRKNTLRMLLAGIRQAELEKRTASAKKKAGDGDLTQAQLAELDAIRLTDDEALTVLQKEAKARREAIADAQAAGRADLAAAGEAELAIVESYLPKQLSREEIAQLARAAIAESGATDPKQIGAVMKLLVPRTRGRADGKLVSEIAREMLGGS